ncbi:hypothetical protein F4553_003501 [Allocatelliglobosispora scoriae]|uniref:Uncharacterized protein n=1 Tax=Allocatelliglobosispora scoriae TaxID=643052 RepID=A0A841BTP7_9ACTN|nr:hypothetical protein [Allocatelliglobosispora scoriae]MBB5870122.1 hypothetical protein [Allocatelliglobosispora scoriae]
MRVLRVLVGVLLLLIAVPTLILGAGGWYAMEHRDSEGEFRASLQAIASPGYAVVVPDLDALLRRDAPFVRAGRTRLTVSAPGDRQLFVGVAAPADVAEVLGGAGYTRIDQVRLGRGPLELHATALAGTGRPQAPVSMQGIWKSAGSNMLRLDPASWRGKIVALVVTAADGEPLGDITLVAALDPKWLGSATWGLLVVGPLLLLLGFAVLAWPPRARPVLYVLETVPPTPTPVPAQPTKAVAIAAAAVAAPPRGTAAVSGPPLERMPVLAAAHGNMPYAGREPFTRPTKAANASPNAYPTVQPPHTPLIRVDQGKTRRISDTRDGESSLDQREFGGEGLPGWPVREVARRTERAVSAPTEELPVVVVLSPLEVPTSEMPLVGAPVRMRLTR